MHACSFLGNFAPRQASKLSGRISTTNGGRAAAAPQAAAPPMPCPTQPNRFRSLAGEPAEDTARPSDGRGPASPAVTRHPDCAPRAPETAAYPKGERAIMRRKLGIQCLRGASMPSWTAAGRAVTLALVLV